MQTRPKTHLSVKLIKPGSAIQKLLRIVQLSSLRMKMVRNNESKVSENVVGKFKPRLKKKNSNQRVNGMVQ